MATENQSGGAGLQRVLCRGEERVELHVLPLDDDHHVLVALAGTGDTPARVKGQGPFPRAAVAAAVARRIAGVLENQGFHRVDGGTRWQLDAWRHRRDVARSRADFPLRTDFHPDDWLGDLR